MCLHEGLDAPQIAAIAKVSEQRSQWHLDALKKGKLVSALYTSGSDWSGQPGRAEWSAQPAGRDYLMKHGMLS